MYLALEGGAGWVLSPKVGGRISSAPFSYARIAVALIIAIILVAPFVWWGLRTAS
jgi:threonine/homoserine efflux transporter RhtA